MSSEIEKWKSTKCTKVKAFLLVVDKQLVSAADLFQEVTVFGQEGGGLHCQLILAALVRSVWVCYTGTDN